MNKEHHIKDIVYFMYNNKPAKGVVIGESKQKEIRLKVEDEEELLQCLNSNYSLKEHIESGNTNFNKIVMIESTDKYDKYTPIDGWFNSNDLYKDVNDLFCALLETKL